APAAPAAPGARRGAGRGRVRAAGVPPRPGARLTLVFCGCSPPAPRPPTPPADLTAVDRAVSLPEASAPPRRTIGTAAPATPTLFSAREPLRSRDLTAAEISSFWGQDLRQAERDGDRLLSCFTDAHPHVLLRAKELRVLRPHGQLLRTGDRLTPDEASLTTTVWMDGVPSALLTQGHVSINRFLSTTRSYLGLQRAHGLRVF